MRITFPQCDLKLSLARNKRKSRMANPHRGSTLDGFLEGEGVLAEFQARAIKEVIAWQLADAMKTR